MRHTEHIRILSFCQQITEMFHQVEKIKRRFARIPEQNKKLSEALQKLDDLEQLLMDALIVEAEQTNNKQLTQLINLFNI